MIEVTRLNGTPMIVNSDLIKIAESSPDTMLTLIHGEKLIVRESCEEVVEKVLQYRARLLAAVADRPGAPADLNKVVAIASLNLDNVKDSPAMGNGEPGKSSPMLKLEPNPR
ncbi:MAG TPA: flagellar FlbD family protein [Acidobacteriaceae bacterium]|jgi:flagellar protein FlbD|nr:flagellar FlbD family protein [Acidobacteriaceae bacterium]